MYQQLFNSVSIVETPNDLIGSVQRSLTILEFISENPIGVNIKQISHKLGLNLSTCYHLINTLVACGYVVKNPDNSLFCLSGKIGYVLHENVSPSRLAQLLNPYVKSLREITNETTYASIWDDNEIYIASISESPLSVRVHALNLGFCEANHATALGKAVLAYWDEDRLKKFIAKHQLTAYTEKTITNFDKLKVELETVRKKGYSLDNEENLLDVFCLGAPIFDARGMVIASIAIALPGSRFQKAGEDLLPIILNSARAATNMLRILNYIGPHK